MGVPPVFGVESQTDGEADHVETVEITGAPVAGSPRHLPVAAPDLRDESPLLPDHALPAGATIEIGRAVEPPRVLQDPAVVRAAVRSHPRAVTVERMPYPPEAQRHGWEGTVMLRVTVGPQGGVESVILQRSSGRTVLDEAAMEMVRRWTFEPARDGAFPTVGTMELQVEFVLPK